MKKYRRPVKDLSTGYLYEDARGFDFREEEGRWEIIYPDVDTWGERKCREWLEYHGYEPDHDQGDLTDLQDQVLGVMERDEKFVPMMNYIYPISTSKLCHVDPASAGDAG